MRSVSSDASSERMVQTPSDRAARSRVRLLMLFEPGRATAEGFRRRASRRRDSVVIAALESVNKACYYAEKR